MTASTLLLLAAVLTAPQQAPAPGSDATPSALVAEQVRAALAGPDDPRAWGRLAHTLRDRGGAEMETAARVAEGWAGPGTAAVPAEPVNGRAPGSKASLRVVGWELTRPVAGLPVGAWLLAGAGIALMGALGRRPRRGSGSQAPTAGPAPDLFDRARSLVEAGVHAPRVARETGLSRDALTLVGHISGAADARRFADRRLTYGRPS